MKSDRNAKTPNATMLSIMTRTGVISSLFALLLIAMPAAARAGLGDIIAGPEQAQANGQALSSSQPDFAVYESAQPLSEVTVHQYVARASSRVFTVDWTGPRMPDLKSLLGGYFDAYQTARSNAPRRGLHTLAIETPELVMYANGPNGNIRGRAWAPALVPANLDAEAVVK
jgi:hypothetical protein